MMAVRNILKSLLFAPFIWLGTLQAQEVDTVMIELEGRKFYQYVVEPGNTLYSISKKYGLSVQEIQEHNPKSVDGLSIGDTLLILAVEEDKQTMERRMEVDGNVLVHEVQKGQTLYAISKIYGIGTGDILTINPDIKKGLKEGQLIRIPIPKLKEKDSSDVEGNQDNLLRHRVKTKETLYSLSKYYGVTIESIVEANDSLPEGLKVGQEIVIPMEAASIIGSYDSTEFKDMYHVALVLPLFLDLNDSLSSDLKINEKESVLPKSAIGLQFYQGFKLALDSLDPLHKKFKLHVFDGAKDSTNIEKILKSGELDSMDLIIGPLYYSQFLEVTKMARENKIHLVCPVPQNNKVLLGNPYVSKVATSQNIQYCYLAEYLSEMYESENIIVVTKNFRANILSHSFKEKLKEISIQKCDSSGMFGIKEVRWDNGSVEGIKNELIKDTFNIILLPSDDQAYVTEFLSNLHSIRKDFLFLVIGVDRWLRYTNIDFQYFENLDVMVPVDGFINYSNSATKTFIRNYNRKFKGFPEKYSFIGGDVAFYYLGMLENFGTRFEPKLLEERKRLFYFKFNFFKTGIESGYENQSVFFLKQDDFEIKQIRTIK